MKKYADYYHDGKIKHNRKDGLYYYMDKDNYLFSKGIYKTKITENDLPSYYIKLWQHPRYKYVSLKGIKDIHYRPSFFTNHRRRDDFLFISYNDKLVLDDRGFSYDYDVSIYGPEIDHFIKELEKYGFDKNKLDEIRKLMEKKDKWFNYWEEHNWYGNYSYTSDEIWKEILGDDK